MAAARFACLPATLFIGWTMLALAVKLSWDPGFLKVDLGLDMVMSEAQCGCCDCAGGSGPFGVFFDRASNTDAQSSRRQTEKPSTKLMG